MNIITPIMCLSITCDDRERNTDLLEALKDFEDIQLETKRLATGDFIVAERFLFERKTAHDFAISLIDGRLFCQARRMVASHLRPVFIIEGTAAGWRELKVGREALQGALINLMLIYNLAVLRSTSPAETARLLIYSGRQHLRAINGGLATNKRYGAAKNPQSAKLRLMQSFPGVGPTRAQALLNTFGSIRACVNATPKELLQVEGMGKHLAKRFQQAVEEQRACYF